MTELPLFDVGWALLVGFLVWLLYLKERGYREGKYLKKYRDNNPEM